MSQGLPRLDLDALPPETRAAVAAHLEALSLQARQLDAERAARVHLEAEVQELRARTERLEHLLRELKRARFGKSSEKLDPQLALTFEDIEIAIGEVREADDRARPNHWDGLPVFLKDGRVEIDNNPVENLIRLLALNRKNALFCDHDEGGASWARASLVETCKLNGVDPYTYLRDTLKAIATGHPQSRLDELLPRAFTPRRPNP